MTDPVSDFLTRLRNASRAGQAECVAPHSKLKESFAFILKNEGYVSDVSTGTDANGHKTVVVKLKFVDGQPDGPVPFHYPARSYAEQLRAG